MTRPAGIAPLLALAISCGDAGVGPPVDVSTAGIDPASAAMIAQALESARSDPTRAEGRAALGLAYAAAGMTGAAAESLGQAARIDPSEPRWSYHLARVRMRLGEVDAASSALDGVLRIAPDYVPAILLRGETLLAAGRPEEARDAFRAAHRLAPDEPATTVALSRAHLALREASAAISLLERLVRRHPEPYAFHLLAASYRVAGDRERAAAAAARSRPGAAPPAFPDPWMEDLEPFRRGFAAKLREAESLLNDRRDREAVSLLESLREQRPHDASLLKGMIRALRGTGDLEAELAFVQQVLATHPDDYGFHIDAASAHERAGQTGTALALLDRAVSLNPERAEAHAARGRLLLSQGRSSEALRSIDAALKRDPLDARLALTAALCESREGRWEEAGARFEQSLRIDPTGVDAWIGLGGCLAELGRFDEAERALAHAGRIGPESPQLLAARHRLEELSSR